MSEANTPPNNQNLPDPNSSTTGNAAWYEGWENFAPVPEPAPTEADAPPVPPVTMPEASAAQQLVTASEAIDLAPHAIATDSPSINPDQPRPEHGITPIDTTSDLDSNSAIKPNPQPDANQDETIIAAPITSTPDDATDTHLHSQTSTTEQPVSQPIVQDWQTVDFPNAISVDALDRQSVYNNPITMSDDSDRAIAPAQEPQAHPDEPLPSPAVDLWADEATPHASINRPVRVESIPELATQPDTEEMLSLIQELNQCNNALLDRVAELEDALERSQQMSSSTPKSENWAIAGMEDLDLPMAKQKIVELAQELELAHHTNKRQQILVETLTGQFENSQERVAELERECARLQQQSNDQTQQLGQSENACRDLRARLQRQQRYTLQFKVALEKALEVAPSASMALANPDTTSDADEQPLVWLGASPDADQSLVPKARQIQPWSAQDNSRFLSKLAIAATGGDGLDIQAPSGTVNPDQADLLPDATNPQDLPTDLPKDLPASHAVDRGDDRDTRRRENPAPPQPSVSFTLNSASKTQPSKSQLSSEMVDFSSLTDADSSDDPDSMLNTLPPEVLQAGIAALEDILGEFWQSTPDSDTTLSPEELDAISEAMIEMQSGDDAAETLAAANASADADPAEPTSPLAKLANTDPAFWQNMARLVDVSADDVLKASLADSFTTFTTLDPVGEDAQNLDNPEASGTFGAIAETSDSLDSSPSTAELSTPEASMPTAETPEQFSEAPLDDLAINNPNWPAPLVRPFRQTKKLQSLAAVDLPNFR
jgi:hypothetical protein